MHDLKYQKGINKSEAIRKYEHTTQKIQTKNWHVER